MNLIMMLSGAFFVAMLMLGLILGLANRFEIVPDSQRSYVVYRVDKLTGTVQMCLPNQSGGRELICD